ncbi:pyridoxine 5'-phosphate synthase [Thalassotalea mangrovi]|uniref:Pyridoxine 5'-phosphate synthase n=1 Tax=Thalassotalea mangrovi TaxID=2572245 RepID=A0A4U1B6M6_9GAMM|nr:pyridoxine 5'-phosphate synthase [Thalassotalea mangrovi]TKB46175.1 pyridoxine 5'-phosphate synthase [Thalassotalea mangrovi]
MKDILLGVNVDHIATLRQARGTSYPDPVHAASVAEHAGADGITIHLREDRRHINDRDVEVMARTLQTRMNLEMAVTEEMLTIAAGIKPEFCCLVPEKREELTTEGGLDVAGQLDKVTDAVRRLQSHGTTVSLFIDADIVQIDAAKATGATFIEIHTGQYAEAENEQEMHAELVRLIKGIEYADSIGLKVNAGHGLTYFNVKPIAAIPQVIELNIGHAIIARAAIDGLDKAVRDMKKLMLEARAMKLDPLSTHSVYGGVKAKP